MKKHFFLLFVVIIFSSMIFDDFLTEQKKYTRVQSALSNKGLLMDRELGKSEMQKNDLHILIAIFKQEKELVLYVKKKSESAFKLFKTYPICAASGTLGPKRKSGDYQVPEGFYHINRFNPMSNFHLSLGINYPNQSDFLKTTSSNPGGDIFIHGSCVTIGCIPMTDELIEEIYLYAIFAKNNGQLTIPVYIYPFKMTLSNMKLYSVKYLNNKLITDFWQNLKMGFDRFENNSNPLHVTVDKKGNYCFL